MINKKEQLIIPFLKSRLAIFLLLALSAVKGEEIEVQAGSLFMGWPAEDTALTCGINLKSGSDILPRRKPVQIVLAIDVSHEMQGNPIEKTKDAARNVIDMLSDGDFFGVITFSNYVRAVFSLQPLNSANRSNAKRAVESLGDENHRDISAGLEKAAEEFRNFKSQEIIQREIILITNGYPTSGTTEKNELVRKAVKLSKDHNCLISTLGLKQSFKDYDEDMLFEIAFNTNGRYYFLENSEDIPHMVKSEVDRICNSPVRDVRIEIIPPKGTDVGFIEGGIVKDNNIYLGDMRPGGKRFVIFDLVKKPKKQRDCIINVYYRKPGDQTERKIREYMNVSLSSSDNPDFNPETAPQILEYDLQLFIDNQIDNVDKNRRDLVSVLRKYIIDLQNDNSRINSEYLENAIEHFNIEREMISNSAIEKELLIKRIKSRTHSLLFKY